jgi:uncharacterized protein YjiS (DUF1127 family)
MRACARAASAPSFLPRDCAHHRRRPTRAAVAVAAVAAAVAAASPPFFAQVNKTWRLSARRCGALTGLDDEAIADCFGRPFLEQMRSDLNVSRRRRGALSL